MSRDKDPECRGTLLGQTDGAIHVCKGGPLNGAKPASYWIPRSQIGYMRIDRSPPDKPEVPDSVTFTCPEWLIGLLGTRAMTPRETECYALMKEGKTGAQIALAMGLTPQSGKMMRKRVNRHLSLEERDHLANLAANACYTRLKPRPRPIWRWEPA